MSPLNRFVSFFHHDNNNNNNTIKASKSSDKKAFPYHKNYSSDLNIYGNSEKLRRNFPWSSIRGHKKTKGLLNDQLFMELFYLFI